MNTKLNRIMRDESGITALETAIILIAFVVVAAIFAFTVLSTGTFLTERSKEAAYAGLQEVRGSVELKGSIVLESTGTQIAFYLSPAAGGSSADLSRFVIHYRTTTINRAMSRTSTVCATTAPSLTGPAFDNMWCDGKTASDILTVGEVVKIAVQIPAADVIGANQVFSLEIKPPTGGLVLLERTAPAQIGWVTDLH